MSVICGKISIVKRATYFSGCFFHAVFSGSCARRYKYTPARKTHKKAVSKIETKCDKNDKRGYFPAVKGKKRQMALYITSPKYNGNITQACEEIGVSRATYYRWQEDSDYLDFVAYLIKEYTDSETANVWRATISRAKKGDTSAQKLFFELKGLYKQKVDLGGAVVFIEGENKLE